MDEELRQQIADLIGREVGEIATELDEIEGCVRLYEFNKGELDSMPKRSERAAELRQLQAALASVLTRSDTVDRVMGGTDEYETLLDVARRVKLLVDEAIRGGDENPRRGPDPDDRGWLITRLANIFEVVAQEKATVTTDPVTNEISGRFFVFVRLAIPRVLFADVTLGDQIKKHLKAVRSS
jgi:hypothetical protein